MNAGNMTGPDVGYEGKWGAGEKNEGKSLKGVFLWGTGLLRCGA